MTDQFNILDYTDGPQQKTGQIIDYTPAGRTTKDDGGFQRGVVGSKADDQYQILTTGQYAGNTNITVNAIVDAHTNACVLDKVTRLMWNREKTPSIYGTGAENLLWDGTAASNEDIFEYCDQANLSSLSGYTDWRVPNVVELYSLTDNSVGNAGPNSTAFPVFAANTTHAGSTSPGSAANALGLGFFSGTIPTLSKITSRRQTILVRLGIEV